MRDVKSPLPEDGFPAGEAEETLSRPGPRLWPAGPASERSVWSLGRPLTTWAQATPAAGTGPSSPRRPLGETAGAGF